MTNANSILTEEFIKCGIDPKETYALAETYRQLNSEQIKEDAEKLVDVHDYLKNHGKEAAEVAL